MVGAVFMDLSRAFDTINHGTLISKLMTLMIRNYHGFVIIFFTDFKQLIKIERNPQSSHYLQEYFKVPFWSIVICYIFQ